MSRTEAATLIAAWGLFPKERLIELVEDPLILGKVYRKAVRAMRKEPASGSIARLEKAQQVLQKPVDDCKRGGTRVMLGHIEAEHALKMLDTVSQQLESTIECLASRRTGRHGARVLNTLRQEWRRTEDVKITVEAQLRRTRA